MRESGLNVYNPGIWSTRLSIHKCFRVNAENVSNLLKMEAMSQSQLVLLAHSTIECADARSAIGCGYKWVGKDQAPPTLVSK